MGQFSRRLEKRLKNQDIDININIPRRHIDVKSPGTPLAISGAVIIVSWH